MKNGGTKVVARKIQDKGCDRLVELVPELALFYGVGCVFRFAFLVSVLAGGFIMGVLIINTPDLHTPLRMH